MHRIYENQKNYFFLVSGGLDSSYGLLRFSIENKERRPVNLIFFDYGQATAEYEWKSVCKLYKFLTEHFGQNHALIEPFKIDLRSMLFSWSKSVSFTGKEETGIMNKHFNVCEIENRNMVIYSILYSYILSLVKKQDISSCEIVVLSGLRNHELSDASDTFFGYISKAMLQYHREYKFTTQFIVDKTPKQILEDLFIIFQNDEQKVLNFCRYTHSCYSSINGNPCSNCPKCKSINAIIQYLTDMKSHG
jgi:7-cyano-7-deazaguanine synthase in queuosine biosynthesis